MVGSRKRISVSIHKKTFSKLPLKNCATITRITSSRSTMYTAATTLFFRRVRWAETKKLDFFLRPMMDLLANKRRTFFPGAHKMGKR